MRNKKSFKFAKIFLDLQIAVHGGDGGFNTKGVGDMTETIDI